MERRKVMLGNANDKIVRITWDTDSYNKYIGVNGNIGNSNNFHYSNLLKVSSGNYVYRFSCTYNTERNTRIHGYDDSGNWVRQLAYELTRKGDYTMPFLVSSDIQYVRISNTYLAENESLTKA